MIRPQTPADQVHDLRKDAKKLRYLLECFGSLLPDSPRKAFVRRLKALQDNLGEHQDAEVHVTELRAISRELHQDGASSDTMLAIGQLTERLDERRIVARAEFAERFAAYDTKATQQTSMRHWPAWRNEDPRHIQHQRRRREDDLGGQPGLRGGARGARVLLWDLDPQGAATFFFRVKPGRAAEPSG